MYVHALGNRKLPNLRLATCFRPNLSGRHILHIVSEGLQSDMSLTCLSVGEFFCRDIAYPGADEGGIVNLLWY